ncbi:universal stress protein [Rhizobium sp. CNPSo 3968]|uniref:universal stress protein n=1 Tax=Rhizobium sp. CNPSo 3968 TaxID=3021408 RepID=UPI000DDF72EB|nr:universal stress protein [Rhizobium sp. CNPSo 3968]MDK4718854.1 universal stress protein [Rhizobium sp. CNPSo 3968]
MFSNILVPTDGSPIAQSAVDKAVEFARDAGATVIFMTVIEPFHLFSTDSKQLSGSPEDYRKLAHTEASQLLAEAEAKARSQGLVCRSVAIEDEDVDAAIIRVALENGCDLIAIASHGRGGVGSLLLGSVTAKVLSHSRIPVLVYR